MSEISGMMPYLLATALLAVGVYGLASKRNVIKMIIGIMVCEYAVNLFLVLQGYRFGGRAPILSAPGGRFERLESLSHTLSPRAAMAAGLARGFSGCRR